MLVKAGTGQGRVGPGLCRVLAINKNCRMIKRILEFLRNVIQPEGGKFRVDIHAIPTSVRQHLKICLETFRKPVE